MNKTHAPAVAEVAFEYRLAKRYADRVIDILKPYCKRIHLAGSVLRQAAYVKDIEIVCTPKRVFIKTDLFGGGRWDISPGFIKVIEDIQQKIIKGHATGKYMQILLKGNIKLDLFMPAPGDYYRQLAIRTGPKEFAKGTLAAGWTSRGWVGTVNMGLRKRKDCVLRDHEGSKSWLCINPNGEKPPVWISEIQFFEWIGLRWTEPRFR